MAVATAVSAAGEVIRLKNGDVIYADEVKEAGANVEYAIGDNSYTIPKSRVQSIENGSRPLEAVPELPTISPDVHFGHEEELLGKIVHGDQVDRGALTSIEASANPSTIAIAYYIAARAEFEAGKYADARRDLQTALRNDSQNPTLLNYYAAVLVRTGSALDAISYADQAVKLAPDSPDAWAVLGYAQFAADRQRDAIESWTKSLALRPDASIQHLLDRAKRESAVENDYSERETGHFVLHYEGKRTPDDFRDQLLSTMESDYQELSREFGSEPRSSIQVVLYTNEAFFDVTRAPSWTTALNDGKLRIPVEGMNHVSSDLARVLRHELAHSFVNQLSMGRCPHWLNEGMAQMLEPRSLGPRARVLADLFKGEREVPLNLLEGSFTSLDTVQASLAYDESLVAVEYIRDTYGMLDLRHILELLGRGDSAEAAMRATLHGGYRQLEDEVRTYLVRGNQN